MTGKRVSYAFPISHRFRAPFHEKLREYLNAGGVKYNYVYSSKDLTGKGDTIAIDWALDRKVSRFRVGRLELIYHHAWTKTWADDLVIIQQENRLISNYLIQITRRMFGKKVAFFGHGRNFQAMNREGLSERFKRYWITKVDWWFAYTQRSADIVASSGFDPERITVFNNAIDVTAISDQMKALDPEMVKEFRENLQLSDNVAIYIGGLYAHKRIDFLLEAADVVRAAIPDFHLIVVGGGPELAKVHAAAATRSWLHIMGPRFDQEKSALASLSRVFLMPGLVGLSVLDSFAFGTPMVTTDLDYHSPEIDYLVDGLNGVMVQAHDDVSAYAHAVIRVLREDAWRECLREGGAAALETYTIEAMARHFGDGVLKALNA